MARDRRRAARPTLHEPELLPWLTMRRGDIERLERLAAIVDDLSAEPHGLADMLRRTPTYQRAQCADLPARGDARR